MKKTALAAVTRELLRDAAGSTSGRAARTIHGGHGLMLRQTVIALSAGSAMAEHKSPGEASLQVLLGEIVLVTGDTRWQLMAGDFLELPPDPHSIEAVNDAVLLLTVSNHG
ncbi:MAG TPA: cupin domain-containing protein [Humibacter sp.]|nr:cupin domain-containing protein [Humibacter sp.]